MSSIIEVNNFIQDKLKELGGEEITTVVMAELLEKAGILKDSKHRPGLPLRNYLRAGRIEGAYQYPNKRWVIRPIDRETKLTVKQAADELEITEHALYKRIERGSIVPEKIGERISIPVSELEKSGSEKLKIEFEDIETVINREFEGIHFEIENLTERIRRLEIKLKSLFTINKEDK